jgi:hypothetical protein
MAILALAVASCADPAKRAGSGGTETIGSGVSPVATVSVGPTVTPPVESPEPERSPEPSETPAPDPYALADGVYPAFIRGVDVDAGTVNVDVVQTFEGWKAKAAALEDGLAPWRARNYKYAPVYIRNENPLLRTLDASRAIGIKLYGECEATVHGMSGLAELADRALPYSTDWYYSLAMRDNVIVHIVQHIAISAC